MHESADRQDTPLSPLPLSPGLGLGTKDQAAPSEDSISVCDRPLLRSWVPTPTQKLDEAQDTPNSAAPGLGLGLGTTDQVEPFQDSMSVVRPTKDDPTAMHDVE